MGVWDKLLRILKPSSSNGHISKGEKKGEDKTQADPETRRRDLETKARACEAALSVEQARIDEEFSKITELADEISNSAKRA